MSSDHSVFSSTRRVTGRGRLLTGGLLRLGLGLLGAGLLPAVPGPARGSAPVPAGFMETDDPAIARVRAFVENRFRRLLGPRGVTVTRVDDRGLRVWISLDPPARRARLGETWTRAEGTRILQALRTEVAAAFPDQILRTASGLEVMDPSGEVAWNMILGEADPAPATAGAAPVPSQPRPGPRLAPRPAPHRSRIETGWGSALPAGLEVLPIPIRTPGAAADPRPASAGEPDEDRAAGRTGDPPAPVRHSIRLAQLDVPGPMFPPGMMGGIPEEPPAAGPATGPAAPAGLAPGPAVAAPAFAAPGVAGSGPAAGADAGIDVTSVIPRDRSILAGGSDPLGLSGGTGPGDQIPDGQERLDVGARRYLYPRDRETIEWDIERILVESLRTTVIDPAVRAALVRPKVVRLRVQFAFEGKRLDNAPVLLALVRDVIKLTLTDRFPGIRIHHDSRVRIRETHERFVYDFDLLDLRPHGMDTGHEPGPILRPLRLTRDRLVDLPTAFPLPADRGGASLGYFQRFLADDLYQNVNSSRSEGVFLRLRRSFFDRFEMALTATTYEHSVEPIRRGIFEETPGGLVVGSLEAKYQLPYEANGLRLALGFVQSFQEAGDRVFFLPQDFDRFYSLYASAGRVVNRHLVVHLGVKQSIATLEPLFANNTVLTAGGGVEYRLGRAAVLLLEVLHRSISGETFSRFGTILDEGGIHVNVGGVIGTRLGDLEILVRQVADAEVKEYQAGFSVSW